MEEKFLKKILNILCNFIGNFESINRNSELNESDCQPLNNFLEFFNEVTLYNVAWQERLVI